jgi:hypothetical protein
MNIALEKCEEHVNGVKKRTYGDAFVRGNNGDTFLYPISRVSHTDCYVVMYISAD